jgi:hypothetical protein
MWDGQMGTIKENGPVITTSAAVVGVLIMAIVAKSYGPKRQHGPLPQPAIEQPVVEKQAFHKSNRSYDRVPSPHFAEAFDLLKPLPEYIVTMSPSPKSLGPVVPLTRTNKVETKDEPKTERDVCAREGGWRVEYTRHYHSYWRCRYNRKHR